MRIRNRLEAWFLSAMIGLARRMGPARASDCGARLGRLIGPMLRASRVADANLRLAMPHLTAEQRSRTVRGVWDNLGRMAAEMPHLPSFGPSVTGPGWEFVGDRHVDEVRERGGPAIFFSGHLANWEIIGPALGSLGIVMAGVYRAASNPLADEIIIGLRRAAISDDMQMFPKGARGARAALSHLAKGGVLGMMMDQKMNDGIPVSFFGHQAMTAPALAQLAFRFGCPVIPIHVERLGAARFRVICEAPLRVSKTGDKGADIQALMTMVNEIIEGWIEATPESWLWLHRRWPRQVQPMPPA